MALSSKACGTPPCKTPTRIIDSNWETSISTVQRFPCVGRILYLRYAQRSSDHKYRQKTRSMRLCQFASPTDGGHQGARQEIIRRRE
jgi:hypothetical protein